MGDGSDVNHLFVFPFGLFLAGGKHTIMRLITKVPLLRFIQLKNMSCYEPPCLQVFLQFERFVKNPFTVSERTLRAHY